MSFHYSNEQQSTTRLSTGTEEFENSASVSCALTWETRAFGAGVPGFAVPTVADVARRAPATAGPLLGVDALGAGEARRRVAVTRDPDLVHDLMTWKHCKCQRANH